MSKSDDVFWKEFGTILAVLVLFGIAMFFLARSIGASTMARIQSSPTLVAARIAPVGEVRVGDPDQQTEATASASMMASAASASDSAASDADPGEVVYNGLCVACHATGVAGAPKLDDNAAWSERMAQGWDAMMANAIKGKGGMPPKGGNPSLSDEDLRIAIEYMLDQAGVEG